MSKIKGEMEMTKLWRIHLFGDAKKDEDKNEARTYCIENQIMAIGWPCRIGYDDIEEYLKQYKLVDGWTKKNGNCKDSVNRIIEQVQENDYIWTYDKREGRYRIAKIIDKQAHIPIPSDEKLFDWFGVYRKVENWYSCENFEVPGKIINSCIKGQTLQPADACLLEYSRYLYQKKYTHNSNLIFKLDENIENTLKNLLHYDDLEDLLGLWLQVDNGYVVFPSTNKQGTKDYEYMLKKRDGSRKAVIQCKTGDSGINASKFSKYIKEGFDVYLVTTFGSISNKPEDIIEINNQTSVQEGSSPRMYNVSIKYLLDWATKNKEILPDRIKYYLDITGY